MFHCCYFWLRCPSCFKNNEGLQKFAELCLQSLIERALKKFATLKEKNEKLRTEQSNLTSRKNEISKEPLLDNDEYFTIRNRLRSDAFIMYSIVIAELFLNYISTLIFIPGEEPIFTLLRWFLAIVLTGSAIIASEKLIESVLPVKKYRKEESPQKVSIPVVVLWAVILIGVEIAIIGVAEARARDIEGGKTDGMLYYGFIILSMLLPIIAGAVRWYRMRFLDAYKNTDEYKHIEARLNNIDQTIKQNKEREYLYYQRQLIGYYALFYQFRTCKENYNNRKGIEEDISNHFCRKFETFQQKADERYLTHLPERQAKAISDINRTDSIQGG